MDVKIKTNGIEVEGTMSVVELQELLNTQSNTPVIRERKTTTYTKKHRYQQWKKSELKSLYKMFFEQNYAVGTLARLFGRTRSGITSQLYLMKKRGGN